MPIAWSPYFVTIKGVRRRLMINPWARCVIEYVSCHGNCHVTYLAVIQLRSFKYDRMKLRHVLFNLDSKYQKNKLYADDESDIDDEWIVEHEESLEKKDVEKAEKKFAKDNEKLVEEGAQPLDDSVLKDRIAVVKAEYKRLAKERGAGKAVLKRERPAERIEEAIQKLDERIKTFKLQMDDREAGKEVALGTRFVVSLYFLLVSDFLIITPVRSITWTLGDWCHVVR